MFRSCHGYAVATLHSPLLVHLGKLVVECEETLLGIINLPSENLVERDFIPFIHRYHGAVHMWVQFIEVYIEADDVFLAPVFTRKPVHIHCPTLYVLVAPDMRVVSPVREVHSLVAKGYLVHSFP